MKKIFILIISLFAFLFCIDNAFAEVNYANYCTKDAALQIAKILSQEVGSDSAVNYNDNFFMRVTTAAIIINNANNKSGSNFYEKIYNLTDANYQNYSLYKDKSFESTVIDKQGELLYIAELVLTGKYTLPKNMTLQASESIVNTYGTVWGHVDSMSGFYDVYFGYEGALSNKDIYGNNVYSTTIEDYKSLANKLKLSDYSKYTTNTVCTNYSTGITNSTTNENKNDTIVDACTNPDILRVIYFAKLILDIVKIVVPIGLVIMGMIDFSKSVTTSDEGMQKKNVSLLIKRIIYAILIFAVPWIVEVLIVNLGNLTKGVNFTDCLENANSETIEDIENGTFGTTCYYCSTNNSYLWRIGPPSETCPGGIGWSEKEGIARENCK